MDLSADDVLAKQACQDPQAFAVLYRRHLHRVYSYLISRVGNVQDAQDLTAQTFLAALKGIKDYRSQEIFGAWLLGIAKHKASDHFRAFKPLISLDEMELIGSPFPIMDDALTERLEMDTIVHLLEKLNPDRAEALRLHYFGTLKLKEVAVVMDKSEGAVKMLIARGLDDLKILLAVKEKTS